MQNGAASVNSLKKYFYDENNAHKDQHGCYHAEIASIVTK